jgi:hypothetical protein
MMGSYREREGSSRTFVIVWEGGAAHAADKRRRIASRWPSLLSQLRPERTLQSKRYRSQATKRRLKSTSPLEGPTLGLRDVSCNGAAGWVSTRAEESEWARTLSAGVKC